MIYVKCINNETYFEEDLATTFEPELMIGKVYKLQPVSSSERKGGMMRIIDGSGEAYLYPSTYFEPIDYGYNNHGATGSLTIYLPDTLKGILHAEALATNKSMSGLVREWIEERLDLPSSGVYSA